MYGPRPNKNGHRRKIYDTESEGPVIAWSVYFVPKDRSLSATGPYIFDRVFLAETFQSGPFFK